MTDSHFEKLLLLKAFSASTKWTCKNQVIWSEYCDLYGTLLVWLKYVSYVKEKIYLPKGNFEGIEKELPIFFEEFGIGI